MADRDALRDAAVADGIRSITRAVGDLADEALISFSEFEASERGDGRSAHLKERFAAIWIGSGLAELDPGPAPVPSMQVLAAMAKLAADPKAELSADAAAATIDKNAPGWEPSWQMSDVRTRFERRYGEFEKPRIGDWMKAAFGGLARANVALEAVEGGTKLSDPQETLIRQFAEYGRNAIGSDTRTEELHKSQTSADDKFDDAIALAAAPALFGAVITGAALLNDTFVWAIPAAAVALTALNSLFARSEKKKLNAANKALGMGQKGLRDSHDKLMGDVASAGEVSKEDLAKLRAQRGVRTLAVERRTGAAKR